MGAAMKLIVESLLEKSAYSHGTLLRRPHRSYGAGCHDHAASRFQQRRQCRHVYDRKGNPIWFAIEAGAVNIDGRNPGYEGKLGMGRLDVFRALPVQ